MGILCTWWITSLLLLSIFSLSFASNGLTMCLGVGLFEVFLLVKFFGYVYSCFFFKFKEFISPHFFKYSCCPFFSSPLLLRLLVCICCYTLLMSHKSLRLCSFFFILFFFFLFHRLNNLNWPILKFTNFFLLPVQIWYWAPLVNSSFQLLFFSMPEFIWFFSIISI